MSSHADGRLRVSRPRFARQLRSRDAARCRLHRRGPQASSTRCSTRYPTKMAALLPALWIVQRERGWVSEDAMAEVAERSRADAGIRERRGDFLHHVSPASSRQILHPGLHDCSLRHLRRGRRGEGISSAHGTGDLGITSADDRFTVIEVECLGACGFATPVMINEEFIESVTPETVPDNSQELP